MNDPSMDVYNGVSAWVLRDAFVKATHSLISQNIVCREEFHIAMLMFPEKALRRRQNALRRLMRRRPRTIRELRVNAFISDAYITVGWR